MSDERGYLLTALATDTSANVSSAATVEFGDGPAPTPSAPGYLTILFGRSIWTAASASPSTNCSRIAGQPTLQSIAQDRKVVRPDLAASGAVVTSWIGPTEACVKGNQYPSWADLQGLRDSYGWSMVSEGLDHTAMTTPGLTYAQQQALSCGSLTNPNGLYPHGYSRAWGLFACPNSTPTLHSINACHLTRAWVMTRRSRGWLSDILQHVVRQH